MPTKVTVNGVYKTTIPDHYDGTVRLTGTLIPTSLKLYPRSGTDGHRASIVLENTVLGVTPLTQDENNWVGADKKNLTLFGEDHARRIILEWQEGSGGGQERREK